MVDIVYCDAASAALLDCGVSDDAVAGYCEVFLGVVEYYALGSDVATDGNVGDRGDVVERDDVALDKRTHVFRTVDGKVRGLVKVPIATFGACPRHVARHVVLYGDIQLAVFVGQGLALAVEPFDDKVVDVAFYLAKLTNQILALGNPVLARSRMANKLHHRGEILRTVLPVLLPYGEDIGLYLVGRDAVAEQVDKHTRTEVEYERVGLDGSLLAFASWQQPGVVLCLYALHELAAIRDERCVAVEPDAA